MATIWYVYRAPTNGDWFPGVPNRDITDTEWARLSVDQRRTVKEARSQGQPVWVPIDEITETEAERLAREAAEAAAKAAAIRAARIVRGAEFDALVRAPFRPTMPIRFSALGDSITGSGISATDWTAWATLLADGGLLRSGTGWSAGVGGNTTAQMLARVDSILALNPKPDICVVGGGTNDVGQAGYDPAATQANLVAIYTRLRAGGVEPVAVAIPPKNDASGAKVPALNAWIAAHAWMNGMACLDFYGMNATATGTWRAGLSADGTHPNPTAAKAMGAYAADVLAGRGSVVPMLAHPSDTANLLPGLFTGDANGDGVADGWTLTGSNGTATLTAGTGDVLGNWQRVTVATAGQRYITTSNLTGYQAGDLLLFAGRLKIENAAGGFGVTVKLQTNGPVVDGVTFNWGDTVNDAEGGVFALLVRVPVGLTSLSARVIGTATGTGEWSMAQWAIRNLTALGVA